MRKGFAVCCAATVLSLPLLAPVPAGAAPAPGRAAAVPAPAAASTHLTAPAGTAGSAGSAGSAGTARRSGPARPAHPVSPRLTDVSLGSAAAPVGKRVSTGEPDAPAVPLAGRELTVRRPSTAPFAAAGVSWAADRGVGAVRVRLRTRLADRWSAWTTVDASDVEADAASRPGARGGTDPVWTGAATGVEARVVPVSGSAPRDVRLTLVDPGASAADATPTATPVAAPAAGTQAVARPALFTRAQWGADPALMGWDPEYSPSLKAGVLHHTAGTNAYTSAQVPAILRSIYAFHSRTRGWGDIGYNFLVDRFGRTWEGRYGGLDSTVIGAHTGGFNAYTVGVSMIGTFTTTAAPADTVAAVSSVFAWKLARWNRDPRGTTTLTSAGGGTSKYPRGTVVRKNVLSGHRDFGNTTCPGDRGYAQLAPIRDQVARKIAAGGPAIVSPAVAPTSVAYGAESGPRVTATLIGAAEWTVTVTGDCPAGQVRQWSGTGSLVDTRWDLRDSAGRAARPGTYRLTLAPAGWSTGYSAAITVLPPTTSSPPATGTPPAAGPAGYVPVAATRVLDTRGPLGGGDGLPLGGGRRVDVPVLGAGGVPSTGVAAVLVSLTGFCSTGDAPLTLWPAGTPRPPATAISVGRGAGPWAALAAVRVGAGGRISVAGGSGSADAALDVVGYLPLAGGARFRPAAGRRVLDVRIGAGETRKFRVTGTAGVPATAAVLLGNLAAVTPGGNGALRLFSPGTPRPGPASLAFTVRVTGSDRVAVRPVGGLLALHNSAVVPVRVVLDVTGWWTAGSGARFTATGPTRLPRAALAAGKVAAVRVTGLPAGATAVVASLSVRPSARTWVAAWGTGTRPPTADLHAEAGRWETNLVVVPVGADRTVRLFSAGSAGTAVLDVVGYYR